MITDRKFLFPLCFLIKETLQNKIYLILKIPKLWEDFLNFDIFERVAEMFSKSEIDYETMVRISTKVYTIIKIKLEHVFTQDK